MAKFALLIGVGHYAPGIPPLPEAESNVQAMQQVLEQKEFEVQALVDPQAKELRSSIQELLVNRRDDDVVVLYFSGHGFEDSNGELYLPTRTTDKDSIKQTAISARLIKDALNSSQATNQVLILDCCYSGIVSQDFSSPKDLASQLISKNRAVLASSTPLSTFSDTQESNLSVCTRYLVEGLQTGLADSDCDGLISINDLYQYLRNKLQKIGLRQFAKLFASEKTREISIARSLNVCQSFKMRSSTFETIIELVEKPEILETDDFDQDTEVWLLLGYLRSQKSRIRQKAAEILGNIRAEIAVPELSQLLSEDEDADVRGSAADALGKIYEKTGVY